MNLFNTKWLLYLGTLIILAGCTSNDAKYKVDDDKIETFYDYKIIAEEGNDNLLVMAQLKSGGEEGEVIALTPDTEILLDNELMQKDSAKIGGVYYEIYRTIDSFAGSHSFVFKEAAKIKQQVAFNFQPFALENGLDSVVSRKNWLLNFTGLDSASNVRIVLTDTTFESEGVNELRKVRNNKLEIDSAMLGNLKNGPIQLTLTREFEQPLKNEKGRVLSLYTIRREFLLTD
jgi:hypothetical protein